MDAQTNVTSQSLPALTPGCPTLVIFSLALVSIALGLHCCCCRDFYPYHPERRCEEHCLAAAVMRRA